jgi:hypothetical protein
MKLYFNLFYKRKRYKRTSMMWDHVTLCEINKIEYVKCNRCPKKYVWWGATSNMIAHLRKIHSVDCPSDE